MNRPLESFWQRALAVSAGIGFILLGALGLLLPVLPGWIFIFVGIAFLAGGIPALRRATSRLIRSPRATQVIDRVAQTRFGRKFLGSALRYRQLRQGLEPSARWTIVRTLLRRARQPAGPPS